MSGYPHFVDIVQTNYSQRQINPITSRYVLISNIRMRSKHYKSIGIFYRLLTYSFQIADCCIMVDLGPVVMKESRGQVYLSGGVI